MNHAADILRRVTLLAACAFREALWQRFVRMAGVIALGLVAATWFFMEFNFSEAPGRFIMGLGLGVMSVFGSVLVIVAGAQSFFSEMEQGSAAVTLTRSMRRSEWILGKLCALLGLAGLFCAVLAVMIAILLWLKAGDRSSADYFWLFRASAIQWLKFSVIASLVLLMATLSRGLLATITTSLAVVVICHFQAAAGNIYEHSSSSLIRLLAKGAGLVLPDFEVFDARVGDGFSGGVWFPITQALLYCALFMALAGYRFRRREF